MGRDKVSPVGRLLRHWRAHRGLSQLDLGLAAGVSARHVSFVETGRAQPSRRTLAALSGALDLPLREQNAVFEAAGYRGVFPETDFQAPELAHVRRVVDFILDRHEPFAAFAFDRRWNIVTANAASLRTLSHFIDPRRKLADGRPNLLRMLFHPEGLRPYIVNWEELAAGLLNRLHREAAQADPSGLEKLLRELLDYPDVPPRWRVLDLIEPLPLLLPVHLKKDDVEYRAFTAITTLQSPHDVTLQELRIETMFPADEASERAMRRLGTERPT